MDKTILVRIITPENTLFEEEANIVTIPGEEGVFGVLPEHIPLIASLKTGITIISTYAEEFRYFIFGGIAQVTGKEVNITTEFAINTKGLERNIIIEKIKVLKNIFEKENNLSDYEKISTDLKKYEALLLVI